jgi:hypothetical protein
MILLEKVVFFERRISRSITTQIYTCDRLRTLTRARPLTELIGTTISTTTTISNSKPSTTTTSTTTTNEKEPRSISITCDQIRNEQITRAHHWTELIGTTTSTTNTTPTISNSEPTLTKTSTTMTTPTILQT